MAVSKKKPKQNQIRTRQTRKARAGTLLTRTPISKHWRTRGLRQPKNSKHIAVVFSGKIGGKQFKQQSLKTFDYLHAREAAVEYRALLEQVWRNHPEFHSIGTYRTDFAKHLSKADEILTNFDQNEHEIMQDIRQNKLGEEVNDDDNEITDEVLSLAIDIEKLGSKEFEDLSLFDRSFKAALHDLFWETNRLESFSEDANIVDLCEQWDRNKGRTFCERWQAKPHEGYCANTVERIFDIMGEMNMLQTIKPAPNQKKTYSVVVVQGSALFRASGRLNYVLDLCKNHNVSQIYVCASDRKLDPKLESAREIECVSGTAPNRKVTTEYKMLKHLWNNLFITECPNIPVEFIQATSEENTPRPGSLETAQKWYRHTKQTGKIFEIRESKDPILAVTNQPFLMGWFTILRTIVPVSIPVEAGGPAASTTYFKHNVSTFLDAVYRYVKEAYLHEMF